MAVRYFPQNSNADTGCDAATNPHDMSKTQGTSTPHTTSSAGIATYSEQRSYQIDATADSITTGSQTYNLSVDITTLTKTDVRFRLRAVDDTGCTRTNSSGYQEYLLAAGAGIKTFSLTLDFTAADEDLELTMEIRETNAHGTREIIVNVQDADTWVDAPTAAAGGSKQVAIT